MPFKTLARDLAFGLFCATVGGLAFFGLVNLWN